MAGVAGRVRELTAPVRPPLVLASASPRRTDILSAAGWGHRVAPADVDETPLPGEGALDACRRLALAKARAGAAALDAGTVLGADTVVVLDGRLLGKPADRDAARAMLADLSGREHEVATAVALVRRPDGAEVADVAVSRVAFDVLDAATLEAYLDTDEWRDKAGAYAIQGHAGAFAHLRAGDLDTVIGLSMGLVNDLAARLEGPSGESGR